MPFQRNQIVLVDTNVVIEAHRTGCWNQLAEYFRLCTVEKVIEETQTGFQLRRAEQQIDRTVLRASMHEIADITDEMRFNFNIRNGHPTLDDGERDLLVHAETLRNAWLLNSPDMAVIRFANSRGWLDQLVSLEAMNAHLRSRLRETFCENYTERWLSTQKTDFLLGRL